MINKIIDIKAIEEIIIVNIIFKFLNMRKNYNTFQKIINIISYDINLIINCNIMDYLTLTKTSFKTIIILVVYALRNRAKLIEEKRLDKNEKV